MSKVFISYKKVDKARADIVRRELRALGVDTYIDLDLQSSSNYGVELNKQIDDALAVLVLWSRTGIETYNSDDQNFFGSEVERGYSRKILVQTQIDQIPRLPLPYNTLHAPDISDWFTTGTRGDHEQWQNVLKTLSKFVNRPGLADLAKTLAIESIEAKEDFVRVHPDDSHSRQIRGELEATFRRTYDEIEGKIRQKMEVRKNSTDELFRTARQSFEAAISSFHSGGKFSPPDLDNIFTEDAALLRERMAEAERETGKISEKAKLDVQAAEAKAKLDAQAAETKSRRYMIAASIAALLIGGGISAFIMNYILAAEYRSVIIQQTQNLEARRDIDTRKDEMAVKQSEFEKKHQHLVAEEHALASKATELKALEDTLKKKPEPVGKSETVGLGGTSSLLLQREKQANERLEAAEKAMLEAKKQSAANTEAAKVNASQQAKLLGWEGELKQWQRRLDDKVKEPLPPRSSIALLEPVSSTQLQNVRQLAQVCDALAGYAEDPDRPANSGTKDGRDGINVNKALPACSDALKAAQALSGPGVSDEEQTIVRRMIVALARIAATQGYVALKGGLTAAARANFDDAIKKWTEAGGMGSGQAYFALARLYQNGWKPEKSPDHAQALHYYLMAADIGHRPAMTSAAAALLGVDWDFQKVEWDSQQFGGMTRAEKGKQLMDRARDLGDARAFLLTAHSMAYDLPSKFPVPYGKDASAAARYLEVAYCNGLAGDANRIFSRIKKSAPAACDLVDKL